MANRSPISLKGLVALGRRRPLLTSVFAIAFALTVMFAVKAVFHFNYWNHHRLGPVTSWMSPDYISRVWKLDKREIYKILGTSGPAQNSLPLARIAAEQGRPTSDLIRQIENLVKEQYGDPPS